MENSAQIEIQVGRGTIEEGREIYIDKPILLDIEIKKEEEEVQVGLEKGQIQQPIKKIMHRKGGMWQALLQEKPPQEAYFDLLLWSGARRIINLISTLS